jgi:hypothetical protein
MSEGRPRPRARWASAAVWRIVLVAACLLLACVLTLADTQAATPRDDIGPETRACLRIDQTAANADGERFHRIENTCGHGVVVFYCILVGAEFDPRWGVGDCRSSRVQMLAAFDQRLRALDLHVLAAPKSAKLATKSSRNWLDSYRLFGVGEGRQSVDASDVLAETGRAPAALYTLRAGRSFMSGSLASATDIPRAVVVPSACRSDVYLSGKCKPDPVKAWIALGRPATVDAALAAMRAEGMRVE